MGHGDGAKRRKWPTGLYLLGSAILVFVVVTAGILVYMDRLASKRIQFQAEYRMRHLATDVSDNLLAMYSAADRTVQMMAVHPMGRQKNMGERWSSVDALRLLVDFNPFLNSVFIGYDTGDYLLLRRFDPISRSKMNPPESAEYNVQSVKNVSGRTEIKSFYFDAKMSLLKTVERFDVSFDPRRREWYQSGLSANGFSARVGPFSSSTTSEWAVAFSRKSQTGNAVVTTMITLNSLSATIAENLPTPHSEIGLFDASGNLFAYHDWSSLLRQVNEKGGGTRPLKVSELENSVLPQILADENSTVYSQLGYFTNDAGREWMKVVTPLRIGFGEPMWLAFSAPLDELMMPLSEARHQAISAALLGALIFALLFYFCAGYLLSALRKSRLYAAQISRFEFPDRPEKNSGLCDLFHLNQDLSDINIALKKLMHLSAFPINGDNLKQVLQDGLGEVFRIVQAKGGVVYVKNGTDFLLRPAAFMPLEILAATDFPVMTESALGAIFSPGELHKEPQMGFIAPAYHLDGQPWTGAEKLFGGKEGSLLLLPFSCSSSGRLLGCFILFMDGDIKLAKSHFTYIESVTTIVSSHLACTDRYQQSADVTEVSFASTARKDNGSEKTIPLP